MLSDLGLARHRPGGRAASAHTSWTWRRVVKRLGLDYPVRTGNMEWA